jgi:hypothetical protein
VWLGKPTPVLLPSMKCRRWATLPRAFFGIHHTQYFHVIALLSRYCIQLIALRGRQPKVQCEHLIGARARPVGIGSGKKPNQAFSALHCNTF